MTDRAALKVVNPWFTASEIATIDSLIKSGIARSRADYVRNATLRAIWETKNADKGAQL